MSLCTSVPLIPIGSSSLSRLKVDQFGNIANWPKYFFGDQFGEIAAMSDGRAEEARSLWLSISKTEIVIDTNVPIVANGRTEQADSSCELNCIARLRQIRDGHRVLLDEEDSILGEYRATP